MKLPIFAIAGKDYRQLAPLFLRLAIGFGFMAHGWAKLIRGPGHFGQLLAQLHVPFPEIMDWVSSLTELLGGLAVFLGLCVGLAALPLICTMLVAMNLRRWYAKTFRATLQGYFLPASLLGLGSYIFQGLVTSVVLRYFMIALPAALPAIFLGRYLNRRLKGNIFFRYVYLGLLIIGMLLIALSLRPVAVK